MTTAPGNHSRHAGLVPAVERPVDTGGVRLKTEVPCCDLGLELPDRPGVTIRAGCPLCQLAYTVEVVVAETAVLARFTLVGSIAIASPRRSPPAEGLGWHPLGQRTHLITIDNSIIGVVTRDATGHAYTARRYGHTDKLTRTFDSVETAARALGDAVHLRPA
jgi:hypothetical protein